MSADRPNPIDPFETWILHRVGRAVEAGEVSAELLLNLEATLETMRDRPQEAWRADALQEIAAHLAIPLEKVEGAIAAFEAQPELAQEKILRQIIEAWLEAQRGEYTSRSSNGGE